MKAHWVFGILMAAALGAHAGECTVEVYAHGAMIGDRGAVIYAAETGTARLFRQIGVTVHWHTGSAPATAADGACGLPIVIEMEEIADRKASPEALANAQPFKTTGICVHIFLDRVSAINFGRLSPNVLSYVLAHEITHVLEGANRHSADGIMKANWQLSDFRLMQTRSLSFAAIDAELIHLGLNSRNPHPAAAE